MHMNEKKKTSLIKQKNKRPRYIYKTTGDFLYFPISFISFALMGEH